MTVREEVGTELEVIKAGELGLINAQLNTAHEDLTKALATIEAARRNVRKLMEKAQAHQAHKRYQKRSEKG